MFDESTLPIDAALARRLVAAQFPQWADLPVRPVEWDGWDNRTFRLGDTMKLRLPSALRYVAQVEKEARWLPLLARHLPIAIPVPLAVGAPGEGYPFVWSVQSWLDGEIVARDRIADLCDFAGEIGAFLVALQAIETADAPAAGRHNFFRGGPLTVYDGETRETIARLGDRIDGAAALAVWEAALATYWQDAPVWVHGDVAVGNLLLQEGRLSAVIDFGGLAVGDPACDLVLAWTFFDAPSRAAFRAALPGDAGLWARARGWALWKALLTLAHNGRYHPAELAPRQIIDILITEHAGL